MIRRIALAGAAGAVALGALAAVGVGGAGAAKPTISNATTANVSCSLTAKAKIAPALKNNWKQADHQADDGETNPYVQGLPDTTFSTPGDNSVSAKAKSVSCSGTIGDANATATITGVKITLLSGTQAVDNPPLQDDNTCVGLLAGTQPEDVGATYTAEVQFKASGAKVANSTINNLALAPAGIGFGLTGGSVTGSVAGGNAKTQANLADPDVLVQVTSPPASSAQPVPNGTKCEASLKIKPDKPTPKGIKPGSASLKKPKGLKKIAVGQSFLDPSPAGASTFCIKKATGTC